MTGGIVVQHALDIILLDVGRHLERHRLAVVRHRFGHQLVRVAAPSSLLLLIHIEVENEMEENHVVGIRRHQSRALPTLMIVIRNEGATSTGSSRIDSTAQRRWRRSSRTSTIARRTTDGKSLIFVRVCQVRLRRFSGQLGRSHTTATRNCCHCPGESLRALLHDVRRLIALSYPGPMNSTTEIVDRDAFIDALDDRQLSLRVREKEPTTLEEALRVAIRLEAYADVADGDRVDDGRRDRPRQI